MQRPDTFIEVDAITNSAEIPRLSVGDALRELKHEVRLFTPALLVTHGNFDRDPVMEFDARFPPSNADDRPFVIDLNRDNEFFFRGLGVVGLSCHKRPPNWDKRLYAITESRAETCFEFLNGIAFSNAKTGYYASTMSYDLKIKDPTTTAVSALTVKIFGVMSNSFVAYVLDEFVAPRAVKMPITPNFKLGAVLPHSNLFTNALSDDPLKMRDN